jgi:energy-coupling factor transporter transmembrane protein EcfT
MGLISAIVVGFVVFVLVQYFAPGLSMWVAIFVAGLVAGLLAEGILKGLFVGLVISVIGIFIFVYFFGGSGTNGDIIGNLLGTLGIGSLVLSSIAGIIGAMLRRSKGGK